MTFHHLLIRFVHVLGMALLIGGSVAAWAGIRWDVGDSVRIATGYEWLFWTTVGVMIATGVGNLGVMAPAVPGPGTAWGLTLTVKLLSFVGLLVASAGRLLVVAVREDGLRLWYAGTAWYLIALLGLAEVLAHG